MKAAVHGVVGKGHFRPEFINRVDETVVFHPLSQGADTHGIAEIQLAGTAGQAPGGAQDLSSSSPTALLDHLTRGGFDPVYGARPLKRAIQQQLENPLAQRLLAGRFEPGSVIHGKTGRWRAHFRVSTVSSTTRPVRVVFVLGWMLWQAASLVPLKFRRIYASGVIPAARVPPELVLASVAQTLQGRPIIHPNCSLISPR
jgi:hypothetical protein